MWTVEKGMEWEFCPALGPLCPDLNAAEPSHCSYGSTHNTRIVHSEPYRNDLESPSSTSVDQSPINDAKGPQISDPVNHPAHYKQYPVEVIEITEQLNFLLGNVVKYVLRADYKGKPLEDLKKAEWYLRREIANREKALGEST